MPYNQEQHEQRQLNKFAREWGYADFNVYLTAGGSFTDAFQRLRNARDAADMAMNALHRCDARMVTAAMPAPSGNGDVALAAVEAEQTGEADVEPVDPHNAQVQGDDHVA